MRFGRGGPNDVLEVRWDVDDDAYWEATRSSNDPRRSHDPLVRRIKELRARSTSDVRRRLDVLKYGPEGQRLTRLVKKRDRGDHLEPAQLRAVAAFEDQLAALYTELDQKGRFKE